VGKQVIILTTNQDVILSAAKDLFEVLKGHGFSCAVYQGQVGGFSR
jgi:hypothetical protein